MKIIRLIRRNESLSSEIIRPANVIELPSQANVELAIVALKSVISAFQVRHSGLNSYFSSYSSDSSFL